MVSFSDLGIEDHLVTVLKQQGILEPFEVQREAIPDGMLGHDICCRAPTGSGKTLAFGLPLLSRTRRADVEMPTALILTPTRELAEQITNVLKPLAKAADLEVLSVYGGTSYTPQRKALRNGVDVVIACPGRLLDLLDRGDLGLADVEAVVIDEADRMADMGFMGPVCDILDECSLERQTILFSATLDDEVAELVDKYQHNPITIEVGPKEVSMDSMNHLFWMTKSHDKASVASDAIKKSGRSIVFCRTRAGVDRVGDRLADQGIEVATLHGGLNQRQRDRAMQRFSSSRSQALVATDVAARGLDIEGVNCVIHFDHQRMARRTSTVVVEQQEQVQKEQSSHWFRIHRGALSSVFRRMLESNANSPNQTSRMWSITHSRPLLVRKERGMSVKADVGGMTSETRAVHERSEATANRMVAEDITVDATGITSAMTEARKATVKEEVIEAVAMTGTTVVSEIIAMVVIRMKITAMAEEMATVRTAIARMTTRMAIGTVTRMATVRTEIARMTTGTVATRMAEETVHKMAGTIVEETSIPRPILVNIAAVVQEGTESSNSFELLFF